jgi:peptide methionine sulfoxide reductase MsrA
MVDAFLQAACISDFLDARRSCACSYVVAILTDTESQPHHHAADTVGNNYSETLRLEYDPTKTNYTQLLSAFWQYAPDPTFECTDPGASSTAL